MFWSDPLSKKWLRHMTRTVVMFLTLTSVAVGLDLLEHMLAKMGLSPWLLSGIFMLERFAFYADAFTFCYNLVVGVWHFCRALHQHNSRSRYDRR
jgi:hypothetical protein